MSHNKFASVTASLLVRKGQASPSKLDPSAYGDTLSFAMPLSPSPSYTSAVTWLSDIKRSSPRDGATSRFVYMPEELPENLGPGEGRSDAEKPRRIVLTFTPQEYETLGLVAVKKGSTRHLLARAAMDAYFEWLVAEYGEACNCIAGGALCRCECAH